MAIKLKYSAAIAYFLLFAQQTFSQGYLVLNGIFSTTDTNSGQTGINISQNSTLTDYTGFFLSPVGITSPTFYTNTFTSSFALDGGFRAFFLPANAPITLDAITANSYTEFESSTYVFNANSPFYLGIYAGSGIGPTYPDPLFGWVQLVNNQGTIQMLGSALEYGGGGIYAGTQNIIPLPEPGTLGLGVVGLAALFYARRRTRA